MNNIFSSKLALAAGVLTLGFAVVSCEDEPDKFKPSDGVPEVRYIRSTDPATSDSMITGAYLSNTICIVGENLKSIHELYFNDQPAVLNTSLITDNYLIVDIPSTIPTEVSDSIYMVNWAGVVTGYHFKALVPAPKASTMSCEWAPGGSQATIYGDYFVNDPTEPMTITDSKGNAAVIDLESFSQSAVTITVPDGWEPGYLTLTSIYGKARSKFRYKDDMNILFDWDGSHGGHDLGHGWRNGVVHADGDDEGIEAIDGSYIYFGGTDMGGDVGATWAEDQFSFNYWPEPSAGYETLRSRSEFASIIGANGVNNLQIKFEVFVPASNPWMSSAMQIMFSPMDVVSYATANNAYFSDTTFPRALWNPWQASGSYDTGGHWATVSVPLSTFTFTHEGAQAGTGIDESYLDGLTFFVWNGGVAGTDCSPVICIDNIRVVPIE